MSQLLRFVACLCLSASAMGATIYSFPPPNIAYNTTGSLALGAATGGLQTAGTLNAQNLFINGVPVQVVPCAVASAVVFENSGNTALTCVVGLTFNGTNTLTVGSAGVNGLVVGSPGATATSAGQQLTVQGGAGGATSGASGAVALRSGIPVDGNAGNVNIGGCNGVTTTATARNGCSIVGTAGNGVSGGTGGNWTRTAGNAGGGSGTSGSITDTTGGGNSTASSGNYTVVTANNSVGTVGNQASGKFSVTTGNVTGQGRPGAISFTTGNATNDSAGNVIFNIGSSGAPASCATSAGSCASHLFQFGGQDGVIFDYLSNYVFDPQTAFTSASNDGFLWLGGATGVPTGTPTAYNADYIHSTPLYINRTAMTLYGYDFVAAAWKQMGGAPANPTASVDTTAVNGTATTYMRSDAAPALSQSIAPTMTGTWNFTPSGATTPVTINHNSGASLDFSITGSGSASGIRQQIQNTSNTNGAYSASDLIDGNGSTFRSAIFPSNTASAPFTNGPTGEQITIGTAANIPLSIGTNGIERLRITGGGRFTINAQASTGAAGLTVNGLANADTTLVQSSTTSGQGFGLRVQAGTTSADYGFLVQNASNAATLFEVRGDGEVEMPQLVQTSTAQTGTVCWGSARGQLTVDTTVACLVSTRRIKQHIQPLRIGLKEVLKLHPVSYELKPEFDPAHLGSQVGLIAEDVAAVDERLIARDEKGLPRGVRYMQLTAVLAKAIQEQQQQIAALQSQVAALSRSHSGITP